MVSHLLTGPSSREGAGLCAWRRRAASQTTSGQTAVTRPKVTADARRPGPCLQDPGPATWPAALRPWPGRAAAPHGCPADGWGIWLLSCAVGAIPGTGDPEPVWVEPGPAAAVRAGLVDQTEGHAVAGHAEGPDRNVPEAGVLTLAQERRQPGGGLLAKAAAQARRGADQRNLRSAVVSVGVEQVKKGLPAHPLAPPARGAVSAVHGSVKLAITVGADRVSAIPGLAADQNALRNRHPEKTSPTSMNSAPATASSPWHRPAADPRSRHHRRRAKQWPNLLRLNSQMAQTR